MIRDRSSEKEHKNVPDLEPEEDSVIGEEEPAEEHIPEEKHWNRKRRMLRKLM